MNDHVEYPGHYGGHLECILAERYSYTLGNADFAHAKPSWRGLLKGGPIPELIQAIQKIKERQAWHER